MDRSRPLASRRVLLALRVVVGGLLAAMVGIHLHLWNAGYSDIDWIGPLFLVNVVAGVLLCIGVLAAPRHRLAVVAASGALLQSGALGALALSVWVGLFGFVESTRATLFWPSVLVEAAGACVLAAPAVLAFPGSRPPASSRRTPEPMRSG
jgi:hypothetical protein